VDIEECKEPEPLLMVVERQVLQSDTVVRGGSLHSDGLNHRQNIGLRIENGGRKVEVVERTKFSEVL
jgi:hypothetical protein